VEQTFVPFDQMQSLPEPGWLIEGFLPKGYLAILASAPKMGKTCFATALALAVSTGEPFAGMKTEQAAVLWCCLEESSSERALVLRQYKPTSDKVPEFLTTTEPLRIDHPIGLSVLYDQIVRCKAGLIVIDPLYAAVGGYSLGENHNARRALTHIKKICGVEGVSALILHHLSALGRADNQTLRVAESAQLAATSSMYMLLTHNDDTGSSRAIRLECRGRGNAVNRTWHFESSGPLDYRVSDPRPTISARQLKRARILELLLSEDLTANEVIIRTGFNSGTTRNIVTSLLSENLIRVKSTKSGTRIFGGPTPLVGNES